MAKFCEECGSKTDLCQCPGRSRSRERKEKERKEKERKEKELPGAVDVEALLQRVSASISASISKKVYDNKDEIIWHLNSFKEDLKGMHVKIEKTAEKIENHEKRITEIESKLKDGNLGGNGGGSSSDFVPLHIEVKGFCTYEERETKGATREQIKAFIDGFKATLPQDERSRIGQPQIRAKRSYKFKVKINPEFIWEVKDQWNEYIQREEIELAGQTPYLIVERSPANQLIFNKMGKSYAALQKKFKDKLKVRGDFRLKEFFVQKGEEEEIHLVSIMDDLSLKWTTEGVALTGMTEAELSAAIA